MKKLLLIALALLLICPVVLAESALEVTEKRVVRKVDDTSAEITIYAQVKNTSNTPVGLDEAVICFYSAENKLLVENHTYTMIPPVLQPGETGYIEGWEYMDAADAQKLDTYTIDIESTADYLPTVTLFAHENAYVKTEVFWGTESYITFAIENTGDTELWDLCAAYVLRAQDGRILEIDYTSIYNTGIAPGGTLLFRMNLNDIDIQKWQEKGYEMSVIETYVYLEEYSY